MCENLKIYATVKVVVVWWLLPGLVEVFLPPCFPHPTSLFDLLHQTHCIHYPIVTLQKSMSFIQSLALPPPLSLCKYRNEYRCEYVWTNDTLSFCLVYCICAPFCLTCITSYKHVSCAVQMSRAAPLWTCWICTCALLSLVLASESILTQSCEKSLDTALCVLKLQWDCGVSLKCV